MRARDILGRRIDPIGTEFDVLKDVVEEISTIRIAERVVKIPGITRSFETGIIPGAVAHYRDRIKKDIMPVQYAKDDNLVLEPLYRPRIFGLNNFSASAPASVPGAGTIIDYTLDTYGRELIVLTDIVALDTEPPVTEVKLTVDGNPQYVIVPRKDFKVTDLHIFELPFPAVADVSLKIEGRWEVNASFNYLPVGLHVVQGTIIKGLT